MANRPEAFAFGAEAAPGGGRFPLARHPAQKAHPRGSVGWA
jgi:hypothetical protein